MASANAKAIPFPFFGAGEATYYESAAMTVVFEAVPTAAQRKAIEKGVPAPLGVSRWAKRVLEVATDDYALTGQEAFDAFNAAIERWLEACHAVVPIYFALRPEDSEAGTALSKWHRESLAAGLAIVGSLAKRYDDAATRADVKATLIEMLRAGGVALPAKLDPVPAWRAALDAGDAAKLAPLIAKHASDIQLKLDLTNPQHRRALIGGRPKLAKHGPLDTKILDAALLDGGADAEYVIDVFFARAQDKPFWATACAAQAAENVEAASEASFALLDRLVGLSTAAPIVVENALWAAQELGWRRVSRERLERYWDLAVAQLDEWEAHRPYLVELAAILGRDVPPASAPPPKSRGKRR